jgi:hypothetical protein
MKWALLLLCSSVCFLISGCSVPLTTSTATVFTEDELKGKLLNIRIERFENPQFYGLIGLRNKENALHYALLDASGVKLLEAEATPDGRYNSDRAGGPLKDSALAPFLSEALARIYLQEPSTLPCAGSWFHRLCHLENADNSWTKFGRSGPFTIWTVAGRGPAGEAAATIVYHQPWLGVKIHLEEASFVKNQ